MTAEKRSRSNPLHRAQRAARSANALDRRLDRLTRDHHVVGIGVHERLRIARDGDVAFPEHQIAAPQPARCRSRGRALPPACRCRAGRRRRRPAARPAPAPSSRCRARSCRPTDTARRGSASATATKSGSCVSSGARWPAANNSPIVVTAKRVLPRDDEMRAPERKRRERRQLDDRTGKDERAQRRHLVRRRLSRGGTSAFAGSQPT